MCPPYPANYVVWTPVGNKVFLVERDDSYIEFILNHLYKLMHFVQVCVVFLPLSAVIILLCHYLVLIYVHFHISYVIPWSSHGDGHCRLLAGVTFLNRAFFRIDFTRPRKTYANIAKSVKYCLLLSNLVGVVRRNPRVILQYLINAFMLVDWREIYSITESRHF